MAKHMNCGLLQIYMCLGLRRRCVSRLTSRERHDHLFTVMMARMNPNAGRILGYITSFIANMAAV